MLNLQTPVFSNLMTTILSNLAVGLSLYKTKTFHLNSIPYTIILQSEGPQNLMNRAEKLCLGIDYKMREIVESNFQIKNLNKRTRFDLTIFLLSRAEIKDNLPSFLIIQSKS